MHITDEPVIELITGICEKQFNKTKENIMVYMDFIISDLDHSNLQKNAIHYFFPEIRQ